jgi:hypothetical protein
MYNNQLDAMFILSLLNYYTYFYMFRAYKQPIIKRYNVYMWQMVLVILLS